MAYIRQCLPSTGPSKHFQRVQNKMHMIGKMKGSQRVFSILKYMYNVNDVQMQITPLQLHYQFIKADVRLLCWLPSAAIFVEGLHRKVFCFLLHLKVAQIVH